MSWKPMVQVVNDDKFYGNALRYATAEEALRDAIGLMGRWTAVVNVSVEESDDPVNRRWDDDVGSVIILPDGKEIVR